MKLNLAGYQETNLLYTGTRTLVYRALQIRDHQPVIIKVLRNQHPHFYELVQFRNQHVISCNLKHPSICHSLALERYKNGYALIMPDDSASALSNYWHSSNHSLSEFLKIALQLVDALHYLHQQQIIHKDIKPSNIIIHPKTHQVKLIDFSISSLLPKEQQQLQNPNVLEGTLAYISPEQTGRMNRGIDYRADFYSLGVTFFELLTQTLPFPTCDPMELVHCHIAQTVKFPGETPVPEPLQALVLKLMAKNAEDRYQSALGLKYDLERCLQQWETTGYITPFELGQQDRSDRFLIPEKLYGRETEVQTLLEAFERVANGTTEILMVAGFSGIGKTAVINEIHKPIVQERGYFIKGKFDQFNRNIPLSAFVQAFRDLMGQLLGASDAELAIWKGKILNALGDNGEVIIDVIPELERILGKQPSVPELSGSAAQNRFNLLFGKFVRIFTTKEHPLVLFLDDLQWADSASLNLLKLFMDESETGYLLMLGAYRDNEVFPTHPLLLTLDEIQKQGAKMNTLTLNPLGKIDITRLVADTLLCPTEMATPLSELVYQKTQGNPFFTTQFLKGLYEDGWIQFKTEMGYWQCDLTQVRQLALTDDVVEFMAQQLQKLPRTVQQVLQFAACLGNRFDLYTLALVSERSVANVAGALWKALQEGLILPQSEMYKFYLNLSETNETTDNVENITYRFLHDRVQQAAYSLIPEQQQQSIHYKIGQLLLKNISPEKREENIFNIVNQLNIGITLINNQEECNELIQLNLRAACKALTASAYIAAVNYLEFASKNLNSKSWDDNYPLTFSIYINSAKAYYLIADFATAESRIQELFNRANNTLDLIQAYELKIQLYIARNQMQEAINTGLQAIDLLGINISENLSEVLEVTDLINLPEMTDPHIISAMQILKAIVDPAYGVNSETFRQIVLSMVNLCLKFGNCSLSAYSYAVYSWLLCGQSSNIELAYQFIQVSLKLPDQYNAPELRPQVEQLFNAFIQHWKEPIQNTLNSVFYIFNRCLDVGNIEYACFAIMHSFAYGLLGGQRLEILVVERAPYIQFLIDSKRELQLNYANIWRQLALNFKEPSVEPCILRGESFDEIETLPELHATHSNFLIFAVYVSKLILCYFFQDYEGAIANARLALQYQETAGGSMTFSAFTFYELLARLAQYSTIPNRHKQSEWNEIENNLNHLKRWAESSPANYQHKYLLAQAEIARLSGQISQAIELFDCAIAKAKENDYIHEEALANELAAQFYLNWGKEKIAAAYLEAAYYCYARWGAQAKTQQLEEKYPDFLAPILQKQPLELNSSEGGSLGQTLLSITQTNSSSAGLSETLDVASLLQAAQVISSTLELNQLLTDISRIILMNAGAQKAALLIPEAEQWQLRAMAQLVSPGTVEINTEAQPLTNDTQIPIHLIHYVKNTQQTVLIDRTKTDELTYLLATSWLQVQPQSVLCIPLLNHGNLVGILYLEHPTTKGVFSPLRQKIVQFLCTQAAISLQNAQLYSQAKLQLVQNEKMLILGNLVAGIAQEMNNPTAFLQDNIKPVQDYVDNLFGFIHFLLAKSPKNDLEIQNKMEAVNWKFIQEELPQLLDSMNLGIEQIRNLSQNLRMFSREDQDD